MLKIYVYIYANNKENFEMIRKCELRESETIHEIINDAAQAYKGVIPDDCWKEPYMSKKDLLQEIEAGVQFWGYLEDGQLIGVMGIQDVADVSLIRHAYVRTKKRNSGIGGKLIAHLKTLTNKPLLIGTWAAANWAIGFYEKHGFKVVSIEEKNSLLKKYWNVSERQIETSVVLAQE